MPLCNIQLIALHPTTSLQAFRVAIKSTSLKPLVVARVIRWIILPSKLSTETLLAHNVRWDLLLILPSRDPLPNRLQRHISRQWIVEAGIPSRILHGFSTRNEELLKPEKGDVPLLTGSLDDPRVNPTSSQDLELSPELQDWISSFSETAQGRGAVSMLNLLSFNPGKKESYLKYGAEFARSIGSRRGGLAKLVGTVVPPAQGASRPGQDKEAWDEIALAHYPSILHFADMLASEDYQVANKKYRVDSLRDTFILCTSELDIDIEEQEGELWKPRL